MYFTVYLFIGAFSGLLAGTLGIGGGVIIVPALAATFVHYAVMPPEYVMQMAIGTSLAALVVTLLVSLRVHMLRGAVQWHIVRQLLPGLLVGILAGAMLAQHLPSVYLRVFFSLFLFYIAIHLLRHRAVSSDSQTHQLPSRSTLALSAGAIGLLSGILGIGGGVMMIPFLLRCQLSLREATGSSVACGVCISVFAAVSFMVLGSSSASHLAWSTGFVYWPAFLGIAVTSMIFAPLGAAIAYRLPTSVLKRVLAIFLLLVAMDMALPNM